MARVSAHWQCYDLHMWGPKHGFYIVPCLANLKNKKIPDAHVDIVATKLKNLMLQNVKIVPICQNC